MWRTLTEILEHHAQHNAQNLFTRFLEQGETRATFTYGQMWAYACRWARTLHECGLAAGERVIIALGNTPAFVGAFYGTLLARGIPAPAAPMRGPQVDAAFLERLAGQVRAVGARVLVAEEEQLEALRGLPLAADQQPALLSAARLTTVEGPPLHASRQGDDIALFQFTSGTAGRAKIVQLSHAALVYQIEAISQALALIDPREDWAVSWLPMFHDMGLIGFLLTPTLRAGSVTLLLTEDFMQRPRLWFRALSDFRASITGAPPSAYAVCARFLKDEEIGELDLRRLRIALIGAENITREALDPLIARFGPCGLRETSLMPTYGLAENGLAVTMPPLGRAPRYDAVDLARLQQTGHAMPPSDTAQVTRRFVSVGRPLEGMRLQIVDEAGRPLAERQVGEVCVHSPSVMAGYYGQPQQTAEALRAGWLHTGDTGYLVAGELYITGRRKELLIIGGQNYYPDDIEQVVMEISSVRLRRVVAFSVEDPQRATERLVLLVESALKDAAAKSELAQSLRQGLVQRAYPAPEVVFVRPKTIEVTDTGKLRRMEAKARYLAGAFTAGGDDA